MVSLSTFKSLVVLVGPLLLPKAIAYYRSVRAAPAATGRKIQPVPRRVARALAILFATASVALISTLPIFAPEDVFSITQSRLQIPTDVLFTRLIALRPDGLTETDDKLRVRIGSLESKLLYFKHGPNSIVDCLYCSPEEPSSYFYYSIPAILSHHLFVLGVFALVTSGAFVGKETMMWRTVATMGSISLACLDLYFVGSYNHQANTKATRLEDIERFFWNMRVYRGIALSALQAFLGWLIYLSSTNRAFVSPPSTAERLEILTKISTAALNRLRAAIIVRNTVSRDEALRNLNQGYWIHEGKRMRDIMENQEVDQVVREALRSRIDFDKITADADAYASSVMQANPVVSLA